MKNEYIIINKTAIQKRIKEWELELQECFKAPIGEFNSNYVSTLQQALTTTREILSQSTPLIIEIEKAFEEGFDDGITASFSDTEDKRIDFKKYDRKEYISNLKLKI